MRIPMDRTSPEPLYRQIQRFLRDQIKTATLTPEMRLPSSRDLSASLGVSRITVTNAYAELEAEGLVYTRPGSGIYVAPHLAALPKPGTGEFSSGDWPLWQQELLSRTWLPAQRELDALTATVKHADLISFAPGMGAVDLFPADEFRKTIQRVLRRDNKEAFGYGDQDGYPPLRTTIAHILTNQGIPTSPDNVLITTGSQQAIALVAHLILHPGDVVLVESPTYLGAIDLFRLMDVRVLGMPMDEHGMIIDGVEEALATARPRLIYTIPTFQNPTGVCLSTARRRQLISLASRFNVPILEDDCFGDLRYEGRTQPALKALDPGGQVIYINTFSKMLMPGLRVGFLAASGPVYDRLSACKRATDLSTCNPIQRALDAYVSVGRYNAHLRKACRRYRRRRNAMLAALDRFLPDGVSWQTPQGGLFLWLQLSEGCSANDLYPFASKEGVTYAPGSIFFPGERVQPYLRLNFALNPPEIIESGIRRLGQAIEHYLTSDVAPNMRHQRQGNVTV
jgi:GntR family transcriptional regulator/MocR family aminotransferase